MLRQYFLYYGYKLIMCGFFAIKLFESTSIFLNNLLELKIFDSKYGTIMYLGPYILHIVLGNYNIFLDSINK